MKTLHIVFGLPWSGKTTVARLLADVFWTAETVRICADDVRKELFPLPQYDQAASRAVWEECLKRAEAAMRQGKTVVWDAVFWHERKRAEAKALARKAGYAFQMVHVRCADEAAIESRLSRRVGDSSDADFAIYQKLKASFQTPIPSEAAVTVDNAGDTDALADTVRTLFSR